jgi:hypothetical protein
MLAARYEPYQKSLTPPTPIFPYLTTGECDLIDTQKSRFTAIPLRKGLHCTLFHRLILRSVRRTLLASKNSCQFGK